MVEYNNTFMDNILEVENLTVKLDKEIILDDLSFNIKEGDVLAILGPNGAGKTVLLRSLLGMLPFSGRIKWGSGIKKSYVPQRLPFIKDVPMSVEEFFKLKKVSDSAIKGSLSSVGLKEEILIKKVGDLSSGQFQRVLIGWSLISNPQVLLFDEPTTGIDIGGQESVYSLLEKLSKERNLTILLVTHDLDIVYKLATKCLCLNKKIFCYGNPKDLDADQLSQLYEGEIKIFKHTHHD